jgi:GT2 family glycosyltransferase
MYVAWTKALKGNYDYYLWLNDDIELCPLFLNELMECNQISNNHNIIVGLIKDITTGNIIYGGTDKNGKLIQESNLPQSIVNMNGNVVLIPKSVVNKIGIIDPVYWHDLGDVDYGLMAKKAGIPVLTTRKAIAYGYSNGKICRVRKWGTTINNRFKKLYSPLGSNPKISFYFFKKHKGLIQACSMYIYLHIINIMTDAMVEKIWGNKFVEQK